MIREAKAIGALAVFRELGVSVDLVHDGVATTGLIAYGEGPVEREDFTLAAGGIALQRTFLLPRQANFSGAIRPGDLIVYPSGGSDSYSIARIDSDQHEAVYRLSTVRAASPLAIS